MKTIHVYTTVALSFVVAPRGGIIWCNCRYIIRQKSPL